MINPLDEIERISAPELYNTVRYTTDPPGPTCISSLDAHIQNALPHLTTDASTLNRGDVLEVQGPSSSGKTHLLYFWCMTCVLPYDISVDSPSMRVRDMKVLLGGRDKVAIICDCDSSWSMIRLDKLIKAHLLARIKQVLSLPPISAVPLDLSPSITSVLKSALSRIHIFKPTSTMSLATTLLTLPTYHSHELPNSEISMLLIDGISSFHWADKSHSEELKSNTNTSKPKSVISPDGRTLPPLPRADTNPLHHVLTSIQKLRTTLGIITILTNWGLYPIDANKPSHSTDLSQQQAGGTSHFFRQHLPPPWPSPFDTGPPPSSYYSSQYNPSSTQVPMRRTTIIPLTHHITLPLPPIPPFSPATTLGEALGDTERKEAVKDHFITAVVRTIGTPEEGGPMRTLVGSFEFGITEDRVLVE